MESIAHQSQHVDADSFVDESWEPAADYSLAAHLRQAMDTTQASPHEDARYVDLRRFPAELRAAVDWVHRHYFGLALSMNGNPYRRCPTVSEIVRAAWPCGMRLLSEEYPLPAVDVDRMYGAGQFGRAAERIHIDWTRGTVLSAAAVRWQVPVPSKTAAILQDRANDHGVEYASMIVAVLVAAIAADDGTVFEGAPWPWSRKATEALREWQDRATRAIEATST